MSASKDIKARFCGPIFWYKLDMASGDPPQLRCTCISPAYQPAGSGPDADRVVVLAMFE
jgi:hypothetical protein